MSEKFSIAGHIPVAGNAAFRGKRHAVPGTSDNSTHRHPTATEKAAGNSQ